jgi:hypothetical protein
LNNEAPLLYPSFCRFKIFQEQYRRKKSIKIVIFLLTNRHYKPKYKKKYSNFKHSFKTRPGPRPGFRVLARSPGLDRVTGSAGSFFFKSKRRRFSKKTKKKSMGLQPGLAGSTRSPGQPVGSAGSTRRVSRVTPGFFFHRFFQPGSVPIPDQPDPGSICRAEPGFKTMILSTIS